MSKDAQSKNAVVEIAVVYENKPDFEIATDLADRVLVERIDWLDDVLVVHQRTWRHEATDGTPLTWPSIKDLARAKGIVARGHFDGDPALADAQAARRAILYLRASFRDLSAVILIRDQDDQPERRRGLDQARAEHHGVLRIVVGLAIVERECWVLTGFDPVGDQETKTHEAIRRELGFDPRFRSHELTACKNDQAKRSAKRILQLLCGGDRDRERACWQTIDVATLRARGADNGLKDYLQEVENLLVELIGGSAASMRQ